MLGGTHGLARASDSIASHLPICWRMPTPVRPACNRRATGVQAVCKRCNWRAIGKPLSAQRSASGLHAASSLSCTHSCPEPNAPTISRLKDMLTLTSKPLWNRQTFSVRLGSTVGTKDTSLCLRLHPPHGRPRLPVSVSPALCLPFLLRTLGCLQRESVPRLNLPGALRRRHRC